MTKTLNVKRRSNRASARPRRTVHRLFIFPFSNRVPHSVQGSARTVPSRKQSCCTPFSVPHSSGPFPQHLCGFQDLLRCLHSVLIGLEIEFFYKAKANKKASCRNFCYSTRLLFLYLFCARISGYAPQWRSSVTLSEFVIFATNGSGNG